MSLMDRVKALEKMQVTVGVHGFDGEQKKIVRVIPAYLPAKKGEREKVNPNLTVAQVAFWNEFGNSRIPARSFLRETLRANRRELNIAAMRLIETTPELLFEKLGQQLLGMVKLRMVNGIAPKNSDYTIRRKGSSVPLKDIGQLITSLTSRVGRFE